MVLIGCGPWWCTTVRSLNSVPDVTLTPAILTLLGLVSFALGLVTLFAEIVLYIWKHEVRTVQIVTTCVVGFAAFPMLFSALVPCFWTDQRCARVSLRDRKVALIEMKGSCAAETRAKVVACNLCMETIRCQSPLVTSPRSPRPQDSLGKISSFYCNMSTKYMMHYGRRTMMGIGI